MTQDELKAAVGRAAIAYVPENCIVGVGTGSTANYKDGWMIKIKILDSSEVDSLLSSAEYEDFIKSQD